MSSMNKHVESTGFTRAALLSGLFGGVWFGLFAALIFVVPRHESTFAENRMALPRVTEWIIIISRWCVKYWYVAVMTIMLACLAFGVLLMALRARRLAIWGVGSIWLLLTLIPLGGFIAIWQFVVALPVSFRFVSNGEKHFESRSVALSSSPVLKDWREQLANSGLRDERLDDYLIFLDALWDREQRVRPGISKDYCTRLAMFDAMIIAEWQREFGRVVDFPPSAPAVASLLIQHDRFFAGAGLNAEEMRLLQARVRALPKSAVFEWDELTILAARRMPVLDGAFQSCAAMDMIRRDELFRNNQWDDVAFRLLCDGVMARNRGR